MVLEVGDYRFEKRDLEEEVVDSEERNQRQIEVSKSPFYPPVDAFLKGTIFVHKISYILEKCYLAGMKEFFRRAGSRFESYENSLIDRVSIQHQVMNKTILLLAYIFNNIDCESSIDSAHYDQCMLIMLDDMKFYQTGLLGFKEYAGNVAFWNFLVEYVSSQLPVATIISKVHTSTDLHDILMDASNRTNRDLGRRNASKGSLAEQAQEAKIAPNKHNGSLLDKSGEPRYRYS